MLIQLALDRMTEEEIFTVLENVIDDIDIIEVGTGVIKKYGVEIIEKVKHAYPEKLLFADMKTCDAGESEAVQAFKAGADITSCMAFSPPATITAMLKVARRYNKEVMIDLLGVEDFTKVQSISDIGGHFFGLHIGKDEQASGMKDMNKLLSSSAFLTNKKLSIAGGIDTTNIVHIDPSIVDIVIIGSFITRSSNPSFAMKKIKNKMRRRD